MGKFSFGDKNLSIFTGHPMKTFAGKFFEDQKQQKNKMLEILSEHDHFILCGDMNMQRGEENFDSMAKVLKDNVPENYKTSIDLEIHSKATYGSFDNQMVDGLLDLFQNPYSRYILNGI
jgi:DNA-binding ferritin-like protein (Dps family)